MAFGLTRMDGTEKPSAQAFREQSRLALHSLWPDVVQPTPEEPAVPTDLRAYARQAATANDVPAEMFVKQIQQESGFNPTAYNEGSGATGIAQIIPRFHPDVDPTNPTASLDYAARWMASLHRQFESWKRALAAYNWGPGHVSSWNGMTNTLPAETRHYLDVILGDGWPEPGSSAPPTGLPYNPDAPIAIQPDQWSCALRSTQWLLRSIGRNPQDPWLIQQLVPRIISQQVGLKVATGEQLAAWITREYGTEMGFTAQYAPVTFDDVLAGAGVNPTIVGGRRWGEGGHWSGIRRADENGLLELANSAPNYTGTGTHLDRAEWEARGPWSAVWLDRMSSLPTHPPAPTPITDTRIARAEAKLLEALAILRERAS